jgi:hypothetical protein
VSRLVTLVHRRPGSDRVELRRRGCISAELDGKADLSGPVEPEHLSKPISLGGSIDWIPPAPAKRVDFSAPLTNPAGGTRAQIPSSPDFWPHFDI